MIKINFEEFLEEYKPEVNSFNENASFNGFMFEPFGKELEYVKKEADFGCVWTLVEVEGKRYIVYGMKKANIGYFVTKYAPRLNNIKIEISNSNIVFAIEKKYKEAKKEFDEALKVYKKLKRKEFLKQVLSHIEDKELLKAIESFSPIEAYPQNDVFIYDGYRSWADSIIFKNWDGEEKAVVIDTDGDFDIDNISVYHKSDISIFFENEDGDELTDFHPELANIPHVPELLEEVEVIK